MLSKFIASILAVCFVYKYPIGSQPLQAFLIGILPVWSEVLASFATRVEPAKIQNKKLLYLDAVIDLTIFVLVPLFWYWNFSAKTNLEFVGAALFFCCGLYRLIRFLKDGLNNEGKFYGLPVTYTGYVWIFVVGLYQLKLPYLGAVLIIGVSLAMVTKRIQIKPSR